MLQVDVDAIAVLPYPPLPPVAEQCEPNDVVLPEAPGLSPAAPPFPPAPIVTVSEAESSDAVISFSK